MVLSDTNQALSAAFSFGILLQTSTGALFIYYKGYGPQNLFQDGQRLVLMLFLLFAALWAQVSFFNLWVTSSSLSTCQALVVITSAFDQLSRFMVEQFFLWALNQGTKITAQHLVLQAILGIRLIMGGVLVGLTRPDFAPVCLARTSVLPIAIVVIALDVIVVGVLIIRVFRRKQNKGLVVSVIGFAVWLGTSIPMILGIPTVALIIRTVVPATGLTIIVGILTMFSNALLAQKEEDGLTPEAQSPFITPIPPTRELFREEVGNRASMPSHNYTKNEGLFVSNPSATPHDSITRFQGNFRGDEGGFTKLEGEVVVGNLGAVSNDVSGYRGSSDVFTTALFNTAQMGRQSIVAPQIISSEVDALGNKTELASQAQAAQQKRSLFGWSKAAPMKSNVRSLGISKPMLNETDGGDIQPFAKIQSVDLATAAANDRERREAAIARSLVANRPAPTPPPGVEGLRKSINIRRKEMPTRQNESFPTIVGCDVSGRSSLEATSGSSTSASLSPGYEEVRRRSPRSVRTFGSAGPKPRTAPSPITSIPKTPLQRKGTIGLPTNPKAARSNIAHENNPDVMKSIMDTAADIYGFVQRPKTAGSLEGKSYVTGLQSLGSVIHRPRPIRRDSSNSHAIFPTELASGHRRSKSSSSVGLKKSLLAPCLGSPTELPPLPPPTSAMNLRRLLPSNTKSMLLDEKIELLFPAPPGVPSIRSRRSSVPSLPRVPSAFIADSTRPSSPAELRESTSVSKRTTLNSFIFRESTKIPSLEAAPKAVERDTYRYTANTYRNLADEVRESWIPGIAPAAIDIRIPTHEPAQQGSANNARKSTLSDTAYTEAAGNTVGSHDSVTYWGSVHSEIPLVDLSKARKTARHTFIQRGDGKKVNDTRALPPIPLFEKNKEEEITVMLDSEEANRSILSQPTDIRRSFLMDDNQSLSDQKPSPRAPHGWHRRIGDELPTFSERPSETRARKMPPPPPLLLNRSGRQATVLVRAAEPSPPTDSPGRALQEIESQLRRLEEISPRSVDAILRFLPNSNMDTEQVDSGRFQLLENLEKEMGQQENQWQQMQYNLGRDSMSVLLAPNASQPLDNGLSRESSQKSTNSVSRMSTRRARIGSSMTIRSKGGESTSTTSTTSSDNSRASVWQQRLAEAQVEYLENAPTMLRRRPSVNFLSVSKMQQIGSPTPPDSLSSETESESESELEVSIYKRSYPAQQSLASLWDVPIQEPKASLGCMWNPPHEVPIARVSFMEPPAMNVRSVQRSAGPLLFLTSSSLWSKPRATESDRPVFGLWGSKPARQRSIVARRATETPQRRFKRVTFLPDIVESPVPLSNKRDTLGIFQFPWGEKSESAVYQPASDSTALTCSALIKNPQARSLQLELEENEYESSHFDGYDEEFSDGASIDSESDDDFDENTLWEIASLLKTTGVPSKLSLLPQPLLPQTLDEIVEDYGNEICAQFTESSNIRQSNEDSARASSQLSAEKALPASKSMRTNVTFDKISSRSLLWEAEPKSQDKHTTGLFAFSKDQLVIRTTNASPVAINMIKAARRLINSPLPILISGSLWSLERDSSKPLKWISISTASGKPQAATSSQMMWRALKVELEVDSVALFSASSFRLTYRESSLPPAALDTIRKPRTFKLPVKKLISDKLWRHCNTTASEHHWISESSVRPKSPSIYSPSSSGQTSPTSDQSSIRSSSTKVSSTWSSVGGIAHWLDFKVENKSPPRSPSPVNEPKLPFRLPFRKPSMKAMGFMEPVVEAVGESKILVPAKSLRPARESRFLQSRDMFEAKFSIPEKVPSQRIRQTTDLEKFDAPINKPAAKPLQHQNRSKIAVQTNWNEALIEAIAAGTPPKKTLIRSAATAADWNTALKIAMRKSYRLQPILASPAMWEAALADALAKSDVSVPEASHFDSSTRHPVFFTSKLVATSFDIHPAAIGYCRPCQVVASPAMWKAALAEAVLRSIISKPPRFDSSTRHPVFFTDILLSTSSKIHPAAIGHCKIVFKASMWNPDADILSPKVAGLWSKTNVVKESNLAQLLIFNEEAFRKSPAQRQVDLPTLESSEFWRPNQKTISQRHWLIISSLQKAKPYTWTAQPSIEGKEDSKMWSNKIALKIATPALFSDLKKETVRRVTIRLLGMPILKSSNLWQPSGSTVSDRSWLVSISNTKTKSHTPQRISSVIHAQVVGLWTPLAKSSLIDFENNCKMWSKRPLAAASTPAMFSKSNQITTRRAPTTKYFDLPVLESSTIWQPSQTIVSLARTKNTSMAPLVRGHPSALITSLTQDGLMWQTASHAPVSEPRELFITPHTAPWEHTKREITEEQKRFSTAQMWWPSMEEPKA